MNSMFPLQPKSSSTPVRVPQREEEEEGDLNKALGVQRFQQILSPTPRAPGEQHRTYNEEDFECKFVSLLFYFNFFLILFYIKKYKYIVLFWHLLKIIFIYA